MNQVKLDSNGKCADPDDRLDMPVYLAETRRVKWPC